MNPGNPISPVISIDNKLKAPVSRLLQDPEYDPAGPYSKKNADNSILKKSKTYYGNYAMDKEVNLLLVKENLFNYFNPRKIVYF